MKISKKIAAAAIACFMCISLNAQTNSNWQPVLNNYDGTNLNEGVEANCSLAKCGADDVVIIKLTNNNSVKLKATWSHLIQNKEGQSFTGNNNQISLLLQPNSENIGACNNMTQLIVKLSDFGVTKDQFEYYIAKNFHLISAE